MSIRNTSTKNADGFQYSTHIHQAFNRQPASEQTQKQVLDAINGISISGGSIDVSTLAKEETLILIKERLNEQLSVNVVDISGLSLEATQADLLTLAERQDLNGVKINPDHPPLTKYDFASNHIQMTMKGPTTPDYRWTIDTENGRDGWFFTNKNGDADGGNCYWYSNGAGLGNQTVLAYQDFSSFYAVVTVDRVDSVNDAPFISCYSPQTGTNDIIPYFAHSRWTFALPSGTQLFSSEQVLIYYGDIPKVHSNLRHLPLQLITSGSNGDRNPLETIYLITTNTASGRPIGNLQYLLQNAGFVAGFVSREYEFSNSLQRKQLANLSAENIPVSVSNFPLPATSIMVSNFPETQPVSIADTVAVSGSFYQETQPVSGTVAISNTSFDVSNFPATQAVSGTVAVSNTSFDVSNFPATQAVSGTVAISNTSFDVSNFPATQPVSGTVAISNTSFDVSNFPATQAVSGTVSVSNTSFEVSNFPETQAVSGTVAFSNTVIDTHLYGRNPSNAEIRLRCDANGYQLNGIVDASGNAVTTSAVNSSRALDVRVLNGASTTPLYINTLDGSGTAITSTTNSTKQGLDTNICNLSTNPVQTRTLTTSDVVSSNVRSGSGTAITSTVVSTKTGLDCNIINTAAIPVSGTFYQATQPVSLTYSNSNPLYCTPGVDVGTNTNTGWSNSSLTATSVSTAIDIQWARTVSVLCRATGAGTLVIQLSVDNTNWYSTATTIVLTGTADTVVNYNDVGARYIRLKSNSIVAGVYATICAK